MVSQLNSSIRRTRRTAPLLGAAACAFATLAAQEPPKVVELSPANFAADVDCKVVKQLTITFDRAMSNTGFSFCGGGPKHPKFTGKPQWKDQKTLVVDVELEPDHDYALGLNCPGASNFRSAGGAALVPVQWTFSTLPAQLPKPAEQQARNKKALDTLTRTLAASYSYYDLRVKDWSKLLKERTPELTAAKTDKVWASAAAHMLAVTEDIHMYLRLGEQTFATGTRAIDSLYRRKLLDKYVKLQPAGDNALYGRTDDGIGYLMIACWTEGLDLAAVEQALGSLRDTKALVVDVRPNSGGDELMAQRIAAWFVEGTKVYGKNRYRVRAGKDGFGPVLEREVKGNAEPGKRYPAPIVVLTSRYVMSSNESFVLMLRQSKDCTVVGQRTFGCSGNPKPHELGNGVTIVVPSWQDLRPDGTCFEGEGLAPDVEVAATAQDLEQHDPILERALELLRKKVK